MNRIIKIILHLFYWMVFCLFAGIVSYRLAEGYKTLTQNIPSFFYNIAWACIEFYLFYFIFYRLIEKQRYTFYFVLSVLVSIVLTFVLTILYEVVFNVHLKYQLMEFLPPMVGSFIIGQTGSLLKGFIRWFEDIQQKKEMEKIMLQNELDMLNAQLNPHFLFNTLNNIDSLIQSNPDKASESLITLSEIMRYMLYDAKNPKVILKNEIAHYQNIIRLQLLRLKESSKINFNVEVKDETIEIAPLLFLPFLENAFKYAAFNSPGTAIDISIKTTDNQICFRCSNFYQQDDGSNKRKSGGIGLSNLKRRLELLYQKNFKLDINDRNGCFTIQLTIAP